MPPVPSAPDPVEQVDAFRESCLRAYRAMVQARCLEEKLASLYHAGKIVGGVYCGRGQEAFSAAMAVHLRKGTDVLGPLIRDQAGRLVFGEPMEDATRTYFGSALGPMRGRDGNVHRGRPREGLPAMISHLGSLVSVVTGMLFARRMRGATGFVGAVSIGDGGTSTGSFHEAVNLAAVEHLPLIIAVANNRFAYSTPTSRQFACHDLVDRAVGYGIAGHSVDGTDLEACVEVFGRAVAAARAGEGPQLVVGSMLRLCGHGEHDDSSYIPESLRSSPDGRDCIAVASDQLIRRGWATGEEIDAIRTASAQRALDVVARTQGEAGPDPFAESWRSLATTRMVEGTFLS